MSADVFGLKGVRIWNPEAIRAGESLRLSCDYDLEGVPLYSIKWYFDDQEFYRFVPKESPPTRVFPISDTTTVDVSMQSLIVPRSRGLGEDFLSIIANNRKRHYRIDYMGSSSGRFVNRKISSCWGSPPAQPEIPFEYLLVKRQHC